MVLLVLIIALIALDLAALRWGYDSRDGFVHPHQQRATSLSVSWRRAPRTPAHPDAAAFGRNGSAGARS